MIDGRGGGGTSTGAGAITLKLWRALAAFVLGALGGLIFKLIGAPLPWTLGSLAMAATISLSGGRWLMPNEARDFARPVVGLLAGSAFTPAVAASLSEWWGAVVFIALYTLLVSLLGWLFFRKICRFDAVTAFFSSSPGGLGELTLLGGDLGGSMRTLVTIHSVRVVTVVFTVPFLLRVILGEELGGAVGTQTPEAAASPTDWLILATCGAGGFWLAKLLRITGGVMILAMLFSAVVHATGLTHMTPPDWLVAVVQVVIGTAVGARFAGIRWRELRNTVLQAFVWATVLLATAVGAAIVGAWLFERSFPALLLAMSPGGMAEMTIISLALGLDAAFVVTCQVFRVVFVLTLAPLLHRLLRIGPQAPPAAPNS